MCGNCLICSFSDNLDSLVSATRINETTYLFQKVSADKEITAHYVSDGTLITQNLFQTDYGPARVAVRDVDCDGHLEMVIIGNNILKFFRLIDNTNITSWLELNSDQIPCAYLANFSTVTFVKLASSEIPLNTTPPINTLIQFAVLSVTFTALAYGLYQLISPYCKQLLTFCEQKLNIKC